MNLRIRPPSPDEWRICRMLLPETFADVSSREYLLCLQECANDEGPRIVGAASFRRVPDGVSDLRLHVILPLRRRGAGSQMVAYISRTGPRFIGGTAETVRETGAEEFCLRNGFERLETLTTVEAEIACMREYLGQLRTRLPKYPATCCIPLSSAPRDQVASLHAQYVAHGAEANPWRALVTQTPGMADSPVMMVDGRVAGILLWELEGTTAVVRSRVAAPGPQGKWINVMLLAEGLDGAWARGARRARFSFTDSNQDTKKLAARFKAEITGAVTQFQRQLRPSAGEPEGRPAGQPR